ncbi:MAG: hypothetical protein AAGC57_11025 [Pseudomonadota bacterium]
MTEPEDSIERTPGRRFVRRVEPVVRVWFWALCIAFPLALFGIAPTVIGIVALTGPLWVALLALVHWGRMLDETMHFRSDMEDGPR